MPFQCSSSEQTAGQRGEPEIRIARESKLAHEDYPWYGRCKPGDGWSGAGSSSEAKTNLKEFLSAWIASRLCYDRDFGTLEVGCVRGFGPTYFGSFAQFDP